MSRPVLHRFCLFALLIAAAPACAQDEVLAPVEAPPPGAPDAAAQARAAAARGDAAEALSRYLRIVATHPDDASALAGAGRAALAVGDVNAAAGFLARAEARDPRSGEVKVGLADTFLQRGDYRGALRYFRDAVGLGVPVASIAADRGLAYDLRGDQRRAQADYLLALAAQPDGETARRLALSQAIAGDRAAALATLDPLLRRQDVPAWRARAFVYALTGDAGDALTDAALVMPRDQVDALAPYLPRLATLRAGEKAAAIHLGRFPGENAPSSRSAAAAQPASVAPAPAVASVAPPVAGSAPAVAPPVRLASASPPPIAPAATISPENSAPAVQKAPSPQTSATATNVAPAATSTLPIRTSLAPTPSPPTPAPVPAVTAEETQAREKALADVLAEARSRARTPASRIFTVAPPAPPPPSAAELRAERVADEKARRAEVAARKKAADEAKAKAAAAKAEAEERQAQRANPARHWVQVAGGANKNDLDRAWDGLKAKWPKQLGGRSPWTTHYRYTNRLLIGPFASSDAAQDWVTDRKKEGLATFRVETNAGDKVERVTG